MQHSKRGYALKWGKRGLSALSLFSVLAGAPAAAQDESPTESSASTAPIRLVARGKPGDTYSYKVAGHTIIEMRVSVFGQSYITNENRNAAWTRRVRDVKPDGTLVLEVRNLGGQISAIHNGERSTRAYVGGTALMTVSPQHEVLSATPLAESDAASGPGKKTGGKNASAANTASAGRKRAIVAAYAVFNPEPFPDRDLHVGDTWTGKVKSTPYGANTFDNATYTAKLIGLEKFHGIPCAKIEYTYSGEVPRIGPALISTLPANTKIDGKSVLSGVITSLYSLDRGALMKESLLLQVDINYHIYVPATNVNREGEADVEGQASFDGEEVAVTYPAYDASLVTPVSDRGTPSP